MIQVSFCVVLIASLLAISHNLIINTPEEEGGDCTNSALCRYDGYGYNQYRWYCKAQGYPWGKLRCCYDAFNDTCIETGWGIKGTCTCVRNIYKVKHISAALQTNRTAKGCMRDSDCKPNPEICGDLGVICACKMTDYDASGKVCKKYYEGTCQCSR